MIIRPLWTMGLLARDRVVLVVPGWCVNRWRGRIRRRVRRFLVRGAWCVVRLMRVVRIRVMRGLAERSRMRVRYRGRSVLVRAVVIRRRSGCSRRVRGVVLIIRPLWTIGLLVRGRAVLVVPRLGWFVIR